MENMNPPEGEKGRERFIIDSIRKTQIEEQNKILDDIKKRIEKSKEDKTKKKEGGQNDPEGSPDEDEQKIIPGEQNKEPYSNPPDNPNEKIEKEP